MHVHYLPLCSFSGASGRVGFLESFISPFVGGGLARQTTPK